jgi:hypothetical protein
MDSNAYALEIMVRDRLTLARVDARRRELVARARAARPGLRVRLGGGLIALGVWLRGEPTLAPAGLP